MTQESPKLQKVLIMINNDNSVIGKIVDVMNEKDLLYDVKGICMAIHKEFGPGLLEKAYQQILQIKLESHGYDVKSEVPVDICVDGQVVSNAFRIDLLVNDVLIIELKAVKKLETVHHKQLMTYLTLTGRSLGLLVNFCCNNIFEEGLKSWCTTPPGGLVS